MQLGGEWLVAGGTSSEVTGDEGMFSLGTSQLIFLAGNVLQVYSLLPVDHQLMLGHHHHHCISIRIRYDEANQRLDAKCRSQPPISPPQASLGPDPRFIRPLLYPTHHQDRTRCRGYVAPFGCRTYTDE
jgi:hypothetical protein